MASRDIVNNLAFVQLQAVGNAATSPPSAAKSKVLDTMGFEAAMVLVNLGTVAGVDANNYVQIVLQESNTTKDADFTNVSPTANSLAGVPSASADFGDMNAPIGSVYPQGLLPAGMVTLPALYTGSAPINATTMANTALGVGYIGSKRYIRSLVTFKGAPGAVQMDILGVLGHAQFEPVVAPAAITAT